jgi:hypothetical protein
MARARCTEFGRWTAALLIAALTFAQVYGSAHALHTRTAPSLHQGCPPSGERTDVISSVSEQHRKASPPRAAKQSCCHALCVMAAVQLASPQVPVPVAPGGAGTSPFDYPATDGFPNRLDRPPKAGSVG